MYKSILYPNRETEWAKEVGDLVRAARIKEKLTFRAMGQRANISPTHLVRMENGERPLDSVWDMVHICQVCDLPVEDFLVKFDYVLPDKDKPIRKAFPKLSTPEQENAVARFAELIASYALSPENMEQILNTATAYAQFCAGQAK